MSVAAAVNFTGGNAFNIPGADTDTFDRTHISAPASALDLHTHTTGLGLQIPTGGLAANAVTTAKLALLAVDSTILAALAVTGAKIATATITSAKMASGEHFTPWAYSPPPGPFA